MLKDLFRELRKDGMLVVLIVLGGCLLVIGLLPEYLPMEIWGVRTKGLLVLACLIIALFFAVGRLIVPIISRKIKEYKRYHHYIDL